MKKVIIIFLVLAIFFFIVLISFIQPPRVEYKQTIFPDIASKGTYLVVSLLRNDITHVWYEELLTDYQRLVYISSKREYIRNNPGQAMLLYPWEPSTSIKVLPFNYEIPAAPANNLSITASRDQFEAASFIISAQKDLAGIVINVSDLYDARGNKIPAEAIDVHLVKVWYQAGTETIKNTGMQILTPELLLKDDTLVNVDYATKTNYLKVTINGVQQYIDISNPEGTFPDNAEIYDTPSLQPFSLATNENKQIWLTVHVPNTTASGDYQGTITITPLSETPVVMHVNVTILPFDLEPAPLEYAIYYTGKMPQGSLKGINNEWKTPQQYAVELKNMKDHGIAYPTLFEYEGNVETALSIRNQSGLQKDHIYLHDGIETGNATNQTDLTDLKNQITRWKNTTSYYGYQEVYIYGIDEATDDILRSERPAWEAVHSRGAKVYAAVSDYPEAVDSVGDLLDVVIFAYQLNITQAAQWHRYGKRIFSYANPEAGVEDPGIYRKNYGLALWRAGYDGEMIYAYQSGFGHIWNDFDDVQYRDHVFAYPTSNGVIDTIQWEGFREGIDDTRYLATLRKMEGTNMSGDSIITDSLSRNEDMAAVRQKLITQILISQSTLPLKER